MARKHVACLAHIGVSAATYHHHLRIKHRAGLYAHRGINIITSSTLIGIISTRLGAHLAREAASSGSGITNACCNNLISFRAQPHHHRAASRHRTRSRINAAREIIAHVLQHAARLGAVNARTTLINLNIIARSRRRMRLINAASPAITHISCSTMAARAAVPRSSNTSSRAYRDLAIGATTVT